VSVVTKRQSKSSAWHEGGDLAALVCASFRAGRSPEKNKEGKEGGKGKGGANVCKNVPGKGSTSSRTLLMRFSTTILHTFSGLATVALVSLDDVASNFRSVKDCVERYNRHACYR
jgi:hypothetical protein